MASLGSLVVSLGLDAAEFTGGLTKAEYQARKFADSFGNGVASSIRGASIAIAGMAASAGVAAIALDRLVKGAAEFKDLEETTGASAEGIASLSVAAATAGVAIDEIAGATIKLTKSLTGVDDESKAAGAALSALGIPIAEFKALDPVGQIDALTKAFAGFADGSAKTAVAVALFGKTGAEQLKVFKALEEQGGRTKILTQQQIEQADAYADAQAKLTAELRLYAQAAATQVLPAVNALMGEVKQLAAEFINVDSASGQLRANSAVRDFAESAVIAIARVGESVAFLIKVLAQVPLSFKAVAADLNVFATAGGAKGLAAFGVDVEKNNKVAAQALEERNRIVAEANKNLEQIINGDFARISTALQKGFDAAARIRNDPDAARENQRFAEQSAANRPTLPALKFRGAVTGDKDDPAKRLLENGLKEQEAAIRREQELMQSRNKFLDLVNDQNLISIKDYYAARQVIVEEGTSKQIAELDKEIAALQKYRDAPGRKKTERADTDGKINELLERRIDLERKAGETGLEFSIRLKREQENYERSIAEVNAQVLELTGNLREAAIIRFDQQNKGLRDRFTTEGNQAALRQLDTLRNYSIAQGEFNQKGIEAKKITDALQAAEDRIQISRQLGQTTELGALGQLGEARKAAVAQLESIVSAQEAVARASQNPALIAQAEQARIALERLRAEADVLADRFRTIFKDSATSAFEGFINGSLSAKQAFRQFVGDVVSQINRITAQQLSESIFGKGGLFGGGSSGGGGFFGDIGKFITGFGGGTASGGGGFFSSLASLFGGGLAGGGTAERGRFYEVNERRPELLSVNGRDFLMMGSQRGKVIPNPQVSGGRSQVNNITVNVPETTTRVSGTQLAADIQRRIAAGSRNL